MKQIPVSDLEGEQLAEWAARAQEWVLCLDAIIAPAWWYWSDGEDFIVYEKDYRPDINSSQAMELQKKFKIQTDYIEDEGMWIANALKLTKDESLELAITRAAISSVYGETVPVEE